MYHLIEEKGYFLDSFYNTSDTKAPSLYVVIHAVVLVHM